MHELKQPLGGAHRKKVLLKGDEWYIDDDDKNILKLLEIRLLGFLLFGIQGVGIQVSISSWEILVKELFLNEISDLQSANQIKMQFLTSSFQAFYLLFRNS